MKPQLGFHSFDILKNIVKYTKLHKRSQSNAIYVGGF